MKCQTREKGFFFILCLFVLSLCLLMIPHVTGAQSDRDAETFVWQDFEYWNAPASYGWKSSCPPYPVYGW